MWEFVAQRTVEAAIGLTKDWLKEKVDARNKATLEKKKKDAEAKHKQQQRAKVAGALVGIGSHESERNLKLEEITLRAGEEAQADLDLSTDDVSARVTSHLRTIERWCSTVGFADMRGSKNTLDIYVALDTFLTPARLQMDRIERNSTIPLSVATAKEGQHCIILGQPGAGKTTAMKKLCLEALGNRGGVGHHILPVLVRFKDLYVSGDKSGTLTGALAHIFGFGLNVGGILLAPRESLGVTELRQEAFVRFLNGLGALIILDGFDELPSNDIKSAIAGEIRTLAFHLTKSKIIMTCRTGEFNYIVDNSEVFEIAPLSMLQIEEFAFKWLGSRDLAAKLLDEIYRSPFADTAIKPLALAHLCAIYERIGRIPEKPKTVYRKMVSLFLEEWDEQRSIRRLSRYAGFESDRKLEFLSHLAYYLTTRTQSLVFSTRDFVECYNNICVYFGLDRTQASIVVSEIESHTGLFLQTGYEQFEFVHKSVQEYLAAEYIVRLPSVPSDRNVLQKLGAEIAIATSISSNPTDYLTHLGLQALPSARLSESFWNAFVSRLAIEKPDLFYNEAASIAVYNMLSAWVSGGDGKIISAPRSVNLGIYENVLSLFGASDVNRAIKAHYQIQEPKVEDMLVILRIRPRSQKVKFGEGRYSLPTTLILPVEHVVHRLL